MDIAKMLTAAGVKALVLLIVFIFVMNTLASMAPEWIAPISAALSIPYFLSFLIAVLITDYVVKNFLRKYV